MEQVTTFTMKKLTFEQQTAIKLFTLGMVFLESSKFSVGVFNSLTGSESGSKLQIRLVDDLSPSFLYEDYPPDMVVSILKEHYSNLVDFAQMIHTSTCKRIKGELIEMAENNILPDDFNQLDL